MKTPAKTNKYIEIVGSNNPMARPSQLTMLAALSKRYTKVAITRVGTLADLEELVAKKPDLVVLCMKFLLLDPSQNYSDSPKIWLSDYLEKRRVVFTGSPTAALVIELNKHEAKQKVIGAGLSSSAYVVSTVSAPTFGHNLNFPLFVKPANRGDGKGIDEQSMVYSEAELVSKITSIHRDYGSDALVEEYLPGREFSVAVIKQPRSGTLLAMPVELTTPADEKGNSFLSEAIKEADSEKVLPLKDPKLTKALGALAIHAFKALGARDYGRIDMRLDALGVPNFIEANLMPGLSDHGYLYRCFHLNSRISYDDMIVSIVELGLQRAAKPLAIPAPAAVRLRRTKAAKVRLAGTVAAL